MAIDSNRIQAIFLLAVDAAAAPARAQIIERECGADIELRQRVEALLAAHDASGGILDRGLVSPVTTVDEPRLLEQPGSRIGPYKLLQQIGEGGMGVVFLAEQSEPVQRKVALKVIKPGMDTHRVVARFEAERQALALMDHPNIARVLDAGATDSGRPYFVMELVKGLPITKYCDEERLTPQQRLRLFVPVCQAVQHAHQKGIIHRDLKPSNILIALYDGAPVPKVIDFGVAKATGVKLTDLTLFTEVGYAIGTWEYMAPEQAELNNLDIDTRADIYGLGATLYELLTGSPPFSRAQLRSAAFDEMLRMIREVEPPRPSSKLSLSEELTSLATKRKLEPAKLSRMMQGDLDWIVMKCLEKERDRRYATASGFAADIQRHLDGEAVHAVPPSAIYRLRKFARKNRALLTTAAAFMALLVAAAAVSGWLAVKAHEARIDAEDSEAKAIAAREQTERVAAHGLIATLNPLALGNDSLSHPEREALWSLASLPDDAVSLRFLDEGTRDPNLAPALCARAEPAAIAAVGLDLQRRDRAAAFLLDRLREPSLSNEQRAAVAFFALELVEEPGPLADACVAAAKEMPVEEQTTNASARRPWDTDHFWTARSHLEPSTLARLTPLAWSRRQKTSLFDAFYTEEIADILALAVERLDSAEAERALNAGLNSATSRYDQWSLGRGLARLADRLEPSGAARVRRQAIHVMNKAFCELGAHAWHGETKMDPRDLVRVALQMDPTEGAAALLEALHSVSVAQGQGKVRIHNPDGTIHSEINPRIAAYERNILGDGLATVAARMDESARSGICADGARVFIGFMRSPIEYIATGVGREEYIGFSRPTKEAPTDCVKTLAGVIEKIEPTLRAQVRAEAAEVLTEVLKWEPTSSTEAVCEGLAELSARLEPAEAVRMCGPAARHLMDTINKDGWLVVTRERDAFDLARIAKACTLLAGRLEAADAERLQGICGEAAQDLIDWLHDELSHPEGLRKIATDLSHLAVGMEPGDAARVCGDLAKTLVPLQEHAGKNDTELDWSVDRALVQLAPRMQPEEAARLLSDALSRSHDASVRGDLAEGLAAVAVRMDATQRAAVCAAAARELLQGMHRTIDHNDLGHLARGLAAVVGQIRPDEQAPFYSEAADELIAGMRSSKGVPEEERRDEALLAIATKMERKQRAEICAAAARALTETDASQRWVEGPYNFEPGAYTISRLAAHMEPADAAAVVAPVMRARLANRIARLRSGVKWGSVTEDGLVGLLKYCDAPTAADAAWRLAQAIGFTGDPLIGQYTSAGETSVVAVAPWNDLLSDPRSKTDNDDESSRGCRLTTPQLVELLKMPTCFGAPRRLILDHLERRYGRRFNTVWSFVRFAQAQRLVLDFTTPPLRANPAKLEIPRP